MKKGNDLREKIKKLLLDDIQEDLDCTFQPDLELFKNHKKLNKTIDHTIFIARVIFTLNWWVKRLKKEVIS